jgi:hypothetical protein
MSVLDEADDILKNSNDEKKYGKEELYGQIWDSQEMQWTDAYVYHEATNSGHVFRILVGGKNVLEMRGVDFGPVLASILNKWSEK